MSRQELEDVGATGVEFLPEIPRRRGSQIPVEKFGVPTLPSVEKRQKEQSLEVLNQREMKGEQTRY